MTHVIIGAGVISGTLAAGIADRTGHRFGRCDEGHRRASDDVAKMVGKMLLRRIERSRRYTVDSPRIRILCAHLLLREKNFKPLLAAIGRPRGRSPKVRTALDQHYPAMREELRRTFQTIGLAAT
jgi:hypothetical protein